MIVLPEELQDWTVDERLGKGSFGEVFKIKSRKTSREAALKICKNSTNFKNEIVIHKTLNHDNIVKMISSMYTQSKIYIFMELADSLQDIFPKKERGNSKLVKYFFKQLLEGVAYLHSKDIIHSDLKMSNLLVKKNILKICDFGISYHEIENSENLSTKRRGTSYTMAPEVYKRNPRRGRPTDMWSVGIILVRLTIGSYPWTRPCTVMSIRFKKWNGIPMPTLNYWKRFVGPAANLVSYLIILDPGQRLCAHDALQDPFFFN